MTILQAIILGLVQGITEFIPVSSSGHLLLFHHLLGTAGNGLAFDVALHAGTLGALVLYFGKDLWLYLKSLFVKSDKTGLTIMLIAATVPAAIIGYLLESAAESTFRSVRLVSINMLVFGLIMLAAEHYYKKRKAHSNLEQTTAKQAMYMGFAQALAVVPGVSRSGSTISAGLLAGLDRVAATRFSFLLGIPITAGAIFKVMIGSGTLHTIAQQQTIFLTGVLTAFVSGMFAIRFMLKYLSNHGLHIFAYYRIVLGISLILLFSLR